ncbi:MAG: YggS family pyridoxal phosphate-dependent enzyme [Ignavibacteriae bacterium]|nr:YggS family pyridoxal phosphate-dependent enzyme [Ignavibacteriota bacterium]
MVSQQLANILLRVNAACGRAGRLPGEVLLLAVTKTQSVEHINAALAAGITAIGENRVQEYLAKRPALRPHEFHFIGHLQRNKVKQILPHCAWIHSVDSLRLAEELRRQARCLPAPVSVLAEVNTSGEASKDGIDPTEAYALADLLHGSEGLVFRGFMTVAAPADDAEQVRPSFRLLRTLCDETRARFNDPRINQLSMGMSGDYEVAIEEGATIVRLGTALFGERQANV